MLHVRLIAPESVAERTYAVLRDTVGVTNVIVLPGAARVPPGDVLLCDVARESASDLVSHLRDLGLHRTGAIELAAVDASLSASSRQAEQEAPGTAGDAVVWEEVESRTSEESTLTVSYLIFLVIATLIAGIGVLLDSPILIVGAMVVGPEFGPLAALCVALVERRPALARRSLVALTAGFPVAIAIAFGAAWLGRAIGLIDKAMLTASRPLTTFIWHPDGFSVVVALLAGVAGILSLTAAKSGALIGVLISVTTVPAAGNLAVALAFADGPQALGSGLQLVVNLGCLVVAGTLTLQIQRWVSDRQRARRPAPG